MKQPTVADNFSGVMWLAAVDFQPRGGLFGWLIDALIGRRVVPVSPPFLVAVVNNKIVTSSDGIIWTRRCLPEETTE